MDACSVEADDDPDREVVLPAAASFAPPAAAFPASADAPASDASFEDGVPADSDVAALSVFSLRA